MASQDFIELMKKLHTEKYSMLSKKTEFNGMGANPSLKVTAVLEKGGKQIEIQSSEWDFIKYVTELRSVTDNAGEHKFAQLKDLNKYNADLEHLVDADHSRMKEAFEKVRSGTFSLSYDPSKLVDGLLKSEKNIKDEKYLPLKKDYHYILASTLLKSAELMKGHKQLIRKYPEGSKVFEAVEIIMKCFWPTRNALYDYNYYKRYVDFDVNLLMKRVSTQLPSIEDTVRSFRNRGDIDAYIVVPKFMDIYAHQMELLKPAINILRIGLELKSGNKSPVKELELAQNVEKLRSDADYGTLFGRLDEQIRHAAAHASTNIDKSTGKIQLLDVRGGKEIVVREYTAEAFADAINAMRNEFFPIIYPTIMIFDIVTFAMLLRSREYIGLLLALGSY